MNRRVFLTALAAAAAALPALHVDANPSKEYRIGDKVANFALKDDTGKEVSLSQFKGKVIVLNFYGFN